MALIGDGTGIAMTDMFISATAALLIVLAIAKPNPPVPSPVQADLIAWCPADTGAVRLVAAARPDGDVVRVEGPEDLAAAPAALGVAPDLTLRLAVVAGPAAAPLTGACFKRIRDDLARAHNRRVTELDADALPHRSVFVVAPGVTSGAVSDIGAGLE